MMSPHEMPQLIEYLLENGAERTGSHFPFLCGVINGRVANMAAYTRVLWGDREGCPPWVNKSFMAAMGGTPLHAVAAMSDRAGQKEKMTWLLEHGASVHKTWMMGGSPLAALAFNTEADPECFDLLVAAGCDPNEQCKPWAPLKLAMGVLNLMAKVRPEKFSDAPAFRMMASGGNPIHFASFNGSIQNIQKLAEHGAANDRKNRFGQLPATVLGMKLPDSHAPEILGDALLPNDAKLRAAVKGLHIVNGASAAAKQRKAAKATDKVLPNNPTTNTTTTTLTATAA